MSKNKQSSAAAQAAVFTGPNQPLAIRAYPVTPPRGNYVLLGLLRSGICGTDVHIAEGRLAIPAPFIPGHEFVGTVRALGPRAKTDALGQPLREGDTVMACVAKPCGHCFNCAQDETASCLAFGVTYLKDPDHSPHFFGGYGEVLYHPAAGLLRVPQGLDLDAVSAFPCAGPTVIRAMDFAGQLAKGELVVVQGAGPVGLFAVAWAAKAGCTVVSIASGSNPRRMALARKLGAQVVLDYRKTTVDERRARVLKIAAKLKRGDGADVVVEASGVPSAIPEGLGLVRTLGRYLVPGQYSASGGVEIQPQLITFKAIKIVGSGQYKVSDLRTYLRFLRKYPDIQRAFAQCITHRYRIADANVALTDAAAGRSVKGVFVA